MQKKCENCKKAYIGRRNQIYCSLHCKNEVNNEKYRIAHQKLDFATKIIKENAKILKRLYYLVEDKMLPIIFLVEEGVKPAYFNYQRKDGHLEFDNWLLEEVEKGKYKIHPPKELRK